MSEPLDETYLKWLYAQVWHPRWKDPRRTYWKLLRIFFTSEFVFLIANDDNRSEDGRALRDEFLIECGINDVEPDWMDIGCSFLEMMIGLSRRLEFEAEGTTKEWFWRLVANLYPKNCTDDVEPYPSQELQTRVNQVIWRTYSPDGDGGLFPLRNPRRDQRTIELWYQLNAYLLENGYV